MKNFLTYNVQQSLDSANREETRFWRKVLTRIVDVILTFGAQNLPLRGHKENLVDFSTDSATKNLHNPGNFLAFIQLMSHYDPILEDLLAKKPGQIRLVKLLYSFKIPE